MEKNQKQITKGNTHTHICGQSIKKEYTLWDSNYLWGGKKKEEMER